MKGYLRVVNWAAFQNYKDRNPPWIKFHNSLLEDPGVAVLPDASKAHLFGIWLLASRLNNKIPADPKFIGLRINASSKVDLKLLAAMGFIETHPDSPQDACNPLATVTTETEQSRAEQKRAETETEQTAVRPAMKSSPGVHSPDDTPETRAVIDAYNETFGTRIGSTPGNLSATARGLRFGYTLEQIRRVFLAVKNGETESAKWCHDHNREFEYLIRPEHVNGRTRQITQGRIDVILNELATGRRGEK